MSDHDHGSPESHDGESHHRNHDDRTEDHGHGGSHHHHHDVGSLSAAILTVSTSRTLDDDPAGDAIAAAFESADHAVAAREVVADDVDALRSTVDRLTGRDDVDVVVTTGGTGVTPDDVRKPRSAPASSARGRPPGSSGACPPSVSPEARTPRGSAARS